MSRAVPAAIACGWVCAAAAAAPAADFAAVAARLGAGTVHVEGVSRAGIRTGTGFLMERRGLVATALHVVEGARRIRVSIPGGYAASDARLLAVSPAWDLAVVSVDWPRELAYPGLTLDDGTGLAVGTEIAVTGFGFLSEETPRVPLTVRGIVSGLLPRRGGSYYILDVAAVSGLSGGPVYRTDTGAVVAVLTRVLSPSSGSGPGGAVPVRALRDLLDGIGGP